MDEVKFRLLNRIENVQVKLSVLLQRNRLKLFEYKTDGWTKMKDVSLQFVQFLRDKSDQQKLYYLEKLRCLRRKFIDDFKALFFFLCNYFPKNLTKMNIFFASSGLFCGFLFGLFFGLRNTNRQNRSNPNFKPRVKLQSKNEVTILVKISSLQLIDFLIYQHNYGKCYRQSFGTTNKCNLLNCGRSGCGIVIDCGSKVDRFQIGEEVWFLSPLWNSGTCSKLIVLDESLVSVKPSNLSNEFAATLAYNGSKALLYVDHLRKLQLHQKRIFILGGDTLIGILLIQLLKKFHATIVATCTNKYFQILETLGCDKILLISLDNRIYDKSRLFTELNSCKNFDAIFLTMEIGLTVKDFYKYCNSSQSIFSTFPMPLLSDSFKLWQTFGFISYIWLYNFSKYLYGSTDRFKYHIEPQLSRNILDRLQEYFKNNSKLLITGEKIFSENDIKAAFDYIGTEKCLGNVLIEFH